MRADAQRNRARILAAAEQVFARGGPAASTEEVAWRAGLAIGTVFPLATLAPGYVRPSVLAAAVR